MKVVSLLVISAFLVPTVLAFSADNEESDVILNDYDVQERFCSKPGEYCREDCDCCNIAHKYFDSKFVCELDPSKTQKPRENGGECIDYGWWHGKWAKRSCDEKYLCGSWFKGDCRIDTTLRL